MATGRTAPGPPRLPVVGNNLAFARDPLRFYAAMARDHGDVVKVSLAGKTCFLLNHPEHVAHVLQTHIGLYRKSATYAEMALLLGQGLLTTEGEVWRHHRRIANPAFHRRSLAKLTDTIFDAAADMARGLRARAGGTAQIDAVCMQAGLDIVGKALFGASLGHRAGEVERNLRIAVHYVNSRAEALYPPPPWLPIPSQRRFRKARAALDAVAYDIISARRAASESSGDLLSMLMNARNDEDMGFSDTDLRDEVFTMLLAGFETTATSLTWTLALLSRYPTVRERVEAEIDAAWAAEDPHAAVLRDTDLVTRVIKESMRVYPPVWSLTRIAIEDDTIGGYAIPQGSVVIVSPYLAHRDPRFWDNPEGFHPERFTDEASKRRDKFCYIPFGAGQRMCIGERFAMLEMKIVLARVLREVRLDLVPGIGLATAPSVVLRPRDPIPMHVHLR